MTDLELLQKCINDLGSISIPAALLEQIGIPIYNVRQNLIALKKAVEEKVKTDATQLEMNLDDEN